MGVNFAFPTSSAVVSTIGQPTWDTTSSLFSPCADHSPSKYTILILEDVFADGLVVQPPSNKFSFYIFNLLHVARVFRLIFNENSHQSPNFLSCLQYLWVNKFFIRFDLVFLLLLVTIYLLHSSTLRVFPKIKFLQQYYQLLGQFLREKITLCYFIYIPSK